MTGMNPGRHGVFDFYAAPSFGYNRPVLNSGYIKAKTLWRILSDYGKRVGVVNMPMTSPPEEINGFMIPGMQYAVDSDKALTWPPDLLKEIKREVGDYRIIYGDILSIYKDDFRLLLKNWREIVDIREKTILYLMEKYEWDVFASVFYSIDVMQHHFWRFYDKAHPQYIISAYEDIIPEFYRYVDNSLGRIMAKLDKNTLFLIVSDHGAGMETEAFYMNNWLHDKGLLTFKKEYEPLWKIRWPHVFYKVLRRAGVKAIEWTVPLKHLPRLYRNLDPREGLFTHELIDWSKTKAYSGNHTEQGVYINLKGREPGGIVDNKEYDSIRDDIKDGLAELKNDKGLKLADKIYYKEELYTGPYDHLAPDLLVLMSGGKCLIQKEIYHKKLIERANKTSGTHRVDGVFLAKGNHILQGGNKGHFDIIDVAPTILYAMGLPVPEDMDGKIMEEIFDKEFLKSNQLKTSAASAPYSPENNGIHDEKESGEIKEMLRGLGYMG